MTRNLKDMRSQLLSFLLLFIPALGHANIRLYVSYSVDKAGEINLEAIEDEFVEAYYSKYNNKINAGGGSFAVTLKRNATTYYRLSFNNSYILLKLEGGKQYDYRLTVKDDVLTLEGQYGRKDDNTKLNSYSNSLDSFISSYTKPYNGRKRKKLLKGKIIKNIDEFNEEAAAKYGEFTPEMEYLKKYNIFKIYLRRGKQSKAMQVGDEDIINQQLDYGNPHVIKFLASYVDMDWRLQSTVVGDVPIYWNLVTKEDLYRFIFDYKLYPNNHQLEFFSRLARVNYIHKLKLYENIPDILDCIDSIMKDTGIGMDLHLTASRLHKKIHEYNTAKEAPLFSLSDGKGVIHNLKDYRGKPVIIDFWATWCGPCVKSMPALAEVYEAYKDEVYFISISSDDNVEKMNAFVEEKKYPWTFLYAGNNHKIKSDYQAYAIPRLVLIDAEGNVVNFDVGHPHMLVPLLNELLGE